MLLVLDKGILTDEDFKATESLKNNLIDWTEIYGTAKSNKKIFFNIKNNVLLKNVFKESSGVPPPDSAEYCLFWAGQSGNPASPFRCFMVLGNGYNLWNRHPLWSKSGSLEKVKQ